MLTDDSLSEGFDWATVDALVQSHSAQAAAVAADARGCDAPPADFASDCSSEYEELESVMAAIPLTQLVQAAQVTATGAWHASLLEC